MNRVASLVWWTILALLLVHEARALESRVTWYLGPPQFGMLTFARDLADGRVFHDWPPSRTLADRLPSPTDVLGQTYVFDRGQLHSRYAPGFPIVVAGWTALLGEDAAHYLNPVLLLTLVGVLIAFQTRLVGSRWQALAAGAAFVLFAPKTLVFLWGQTPSRDLSVHVLALVALCLLVPRAGALTMVRAGAAGAALGFAISVRPDAVLYLLPATLLAVRWGRRWIGRSAGAAAVGGLLGLAPSLAFYGAAMGNPLHPTQSMEVSAFFEPVATRHEPPGSTRPGPGWHGGTETPVQGGGLKLAHLETTLPRLLARFPQMYGVVFLAVVVWGGVVSLLLRPALFVATVPYVVLALLVYGCWERREDRFLIGVDVMVPMLFVEGLVGTFGFIDIIRRRRPELARAVAGALGVAAIVGAVVARGPVHGPEVTFGVRAVLAVAAVGLLVAAIAPSPNPARGVSFVAAVVLAGTVLVGDRAVLARRAPFQRPQVVAARENILRLLEPRAVVITTEDVGRPAENIEFYAGVHALYLTDLTRWRLAVHDAAELLVSGGWHAYLFLPAGDPNLHQILQDLSARFDVARVADLAAPEAMAYFVAAPWHRGVRMELYRINPKQAVADEARE